MLVNRMGTMVLPFMTLYMTESRGVSISKAGFVMTMFGLGAICGAYLGGKLTDKFGFYYIQLFSLFGGGVMFLMLSQVRDYNAILITTFILSFVNEAFRPANASAIAHFSKENNRTRSFSLNRLAINLGWAVGGSVGGFVASKSYYLLFWIDGLTNIGAAVLLWLLLAPSKNKQTHATKKVEDKPIVTSAYKDYIYLAFIGLTILYGCCFFQIFTTIPVYFKKYLYMNEDHIGMIMAINGILIAVLEMVIIHTLEGRKNLVYYIMWGIALLGVAFIILNAFSGGFSLALIFILFITAGEILGMSFMATFWVERSNNYNRGQYAGLYTIAWASAQIIGPGTGGFVAEHYGFAALWWSVGVVCLVTILGFRWIQTLISAPQK